jgi:hypothetical protein
MSKEEIIEKIKQAAFVTVDGTTLRINYYDAIYFQDDDDAKDCLHVSDEDTQVDSSFSFPELLDANSRGKLSFLKLVAF